MQKAMHECMLLLLLGIQMEESRFDYLNLQQPFGQYRSAESLYSDCEADLIQNSIV